MKLYHFPKTRSARVLWAAKELGVDLELISVDLLKGEQRKPEYGDIHPHHKIPSLVDDAKELHLIESGAIATWLQENHDPDNRLAPAPGTVARARYWEWMFYVTVTLDALVVPAYIHSKVYPEGMRDGALVAKNTAELREHAMPFIAKRLGDNQWACGDQFTLADVALGYDLVLAAGIDLLAGHDNLGAYLGRVTAREAFRAAMA